MMFKNKQLLLTIVIAIINLKTVKSISSLPSSSSSSQSSSSSSSSAITETAAAQLTGIALMQERPQQDQPQQDPQQCGVLIRNTEKNMLMPKNILSDEKTIKEIIDENETVRYTSRLDESGPLSITLQPCGRDVIWRVLYNNTYTIASYLTRNKTTLYLSCAQSGDYDIYVTANGKCEIQLSYNRKMSDNNNWIYSDRMTPSKIKFHYQRKRLQGLVKWEKSKLDLHAMEYCLAVNTVKSQDSLCQAFGASMRGSCAVFNLNEILQNTRPEEEKKVDHSTVTVACTGAKTQQLLRGLRPNTLYYIDVFAVHTKLKNKTFQLGSTVSWFNRTRPIQLHEGRSEIGKLVTLGGLAVFSFKVPIKSTSGFFQLHITPCCGSVDIKILKKKQVVKMVTNINIPTLLKVDQVKPGIRYVIRVTDADDSPKKNRVKVSVSTKAKFQNLPQPPTNTTVIELTSLRTCKSTRIAWYSSLDTRKIRYCIFVIKQYSKNRYYNNYCGLDNKLTNHEQFHQMHCFCPYERLQSENFTIKGLSPGGYYTIYVTATLGNGRSLPYNSVRIKTDPICRDVFIPKQIKSNNLLLFR